MPRILPIAGGLILDNTNKEASSQDKFSGVRLEVVIKVAMFGGKNTVLLMLET
uniref:Uncharacterized protein n=1 Tax=Rhizophagus irregularis (strain DAOM 181602 / DAOM 197198 / MUCL 43194) TaxID=747089 RepID=U9TNT6_RHIID